MQSILIIEDEKDIAELERDYLEINGFQSDIAATGEEGLKLAAANSYSLILLDLMLPGIDGFDLCEKLRSTLDVPILMVTARKEDIDKIRGLGRGADDYIVKPFNPNELIARVKAHIARYDRLTKRDRKSNELHLKNLTIDHDSRRVFINGQEKTFSAKEYDLLYFLASNPNIVFTKEHLFEQIWGYDAIGDNTTVTVHIRKIREKIEENPSLPKFIETIWGVGYRFQE
ncbi:response regulator transcription factor [Oceanobacillus sojae]|uniref:DNA-binding response regulator n=1 Tax=Oceanobacillus sojae TaxID=582851 RepID=A0A511ZM97_9BACI|nr:response regulator transcription factor [Oceanobacillus sojae]GEN88557.1 DNA-binding response regulator [Oceanobacillus sojae]